MNVLSLVPRFLFVLLLLLAASPALLASDWPPIPPEELALKDSPTHPGSHAIILFHEVRTDDVTSAVVYHTRIKILAEQGKKYANIELRYLRQYFTIRDVRARTVRPDGTSVEFEGEVFEKTLVKGRYVKLLGRNVKFLAKTFSLPDVQVGSIIEYRYREQWDPLFAFAESATRGRLLFFDPTSSMTPLGYLPPSLQANYGLLTSAQGGELVQLPLLNPVTNRLMRTAKLSLSPGGTLSGEVYEVRWGSPATQRRAAFLDEKVPDRARVLENFLAGFLPGFQLTGAQVENLEKFDASLILKYRFVAERYGQSSGNLLLFRPRVLGGKGNSLLEIKEGKYPVEFDDATLQTDQFEIALPPGYAVDELPAPVRVEYPFADSQSSIELKGNVLHYSRTFRIKEIRVPTERLDELKKFYRAIAADERSSAVLKRTIP
jgi:hypothetical protein